MPQNASFGIFVLRVWGARDGSSGAGKGGKFSTIKRLCNVRQFCNSVCSGHYLFQISQAIHFGALPEGLASMIPGKLIKARWLTTANRILRLYVATKKPTKKFIEIVTFILTVYVVMQYRVRTQSSIADGPRHVFETIHRSRYLPRKYQAVVHSSIQTNAFFALPENVLLAMMTDRRLVARQDALNKILSAREAEAGNLHHSIRYNIVPRLY